MDYVQSTLLILFYLHHFPLLAAVSLLGELLKSLLFSLGFRVCVVFIHEKENMQRFSRLLLRHNQPMAVPV